MWISQDVNESLKTQLNACLQLYRYPCGGCISRNWMPIGVNKRIFPLLTDFKCKWWHIFAKWTAKGVNLFLWSEGFQDLFASSEYKQMLVVVANQIGTLRIIDNFKRITWTSPKIIIRTLMTLCYLMRERELKTKLVRWCEYAHRVLGRMFCGVAYKSTKNDNNISNNNNNKWKLII